jgi:uncharacterized phage protein (TIGR02220 family)
MNYNSNKSYHDSVAMLVGVEAAVLFHSLFLWCDYNEKHEKNERDGRYWTFQTATHIVKDFPYWNESKVERMISTLVDVGIIDVCLYNKHKYDRTRWFAVNYKKLNSILQQQNNETAILESRSTNVDDTNKIDNTNSENKIDNYTLFVQFLNQTLNRNFRTHSATLRASLNKRIKEGWTLEQMKSAVLEAMQIKTHIESKYRWLTPEFFVRESTLNKYGMSNINVPQDSEPTKVEGVYLHKPSGKYWKEYSADKKKYVCQYNGNFEYNDDGTKIPFEA